MRAILSVYDKSGLADFARGLHSLGCELFSTGNTHRTLAEAGLPVTQISDLTGSPEILDGRVKTLHPKVHGGILARRDLPSHQAQLEEHGIHPIDLVVSNLYPFVDTISQSKVTPEDAIEQIDIGGPTMVRSAAKNHEHVLIVVDPSDYSRVLAALQTNLVTSDLRRALAQKAFEHTARYDAFVSAYFASLNGEQFPGSVSLPLTRSIAFSYGENPHQQGALYRLADPRLAGPSLADMHQLQGDAISYNNLLDLDSAYAIVAEFDEPCVAIVKHNSPCGVGVGKTITEAYEKAYSGDPLSAFGGVVAANRPVGGPMAKAMSGVLYWVVIAPEITENAREAFKTRQTRLFTLPVPQRPTGGLPSLQHHYRPVLGGFLTQTHDAVPIDQIEFNTVSRRAPTDAELRDLRFAWRVVKHIRSNAAVFVRDQTVIGVGAGQQSRVDAVAAARRVAARSAADAKREGVTPDRPAAGCVMATDGFFAFPDAVEEAIAAGATAIAHPGGGKQDVLAAQTADAHGVAMVVTGIRHFRH
ncbi:MAG TPA: bifunctional phosphoribosylaminoimidazolecarboxamide formyltransferase/IMP cyclohydrolase [Chloroflexota bacterium]|nr:bifunctional phosphoribosylaminoimidazolecarboxamide formyltransferase/IMP cyclohydrolase [Chloroflexota bacterium]